LPKTALRFVVLNLAEILAIDQTAFANHLTRSGIADSLRTLELENPIWSEVLASLEKTGELDKSTTTAIRDSVLI
jgi:hypothetical protein